MASSSGDLTNGGGATASAPTTTTTTTKPLTMFYNGGVAVFHLPQDKAEVVMNMAAGEDGRDDDGGRHRRPNHGEELLAKLRQGMPIASKRSLQRFFQKRKERVYPTMLQVKFSAC
ncbi:protein TIFY 9-like isoform X1 [Miscanthus floridulus]|uniref:protein TIFY 9-like isoform X1 n=2 Tax=Miscanthus floridulus TaxID=154761 RepID=UPI003457DFC6